MITESYHISSEAEELIGDLRSYPDAVSNIFSVDYAKIDILASDKIRKSFVEYSSLDATEHHRL